MGNWGQGKGEVPKGSQLATESEFMFTILLIAATCSGTWVAVWSGVWGTLGGRIWWSYGRKGGHVVGHGHSPEGRRFWHETQAGPGDPGLYPAQLIFLFLKISPYFLPPTYSPRYSFLTSLYCLFIVLSLGFFIFAKLLLPTLKGRRIQRTGTFIIFLLMPYQMKGTVVGTGDDKNR